MVDEIWEKLNDLCCPTRTSVLSIIFHHPDNIYYILTWEYPTGQAVTSGATVVLMVVVVVVGATVVVVVVAVVARQVDGAAAAQVIGEQVPPKIPHWTVHCAEPVHNQKYTIKHWNEDCREPVRTKLEPT